MSPNALRSSAQSTSLSPDVIASLEVLFPGFWTLPEKEQESIFAAAKEKFETVQQDSSNLRMVYSAKEQQKADEDHRAEMTVAKTIEQDEKDEKIAKLYAELWIKNKELTSAKRKLTQADKDMDAATQIEFGPINLVKLALIKRQQKKLDYFMKKDPEAGMRYAYYNGMFGFRHIKRALHKKWWINEDPEKVKKKFEAYIRELKGKADTPKKQAIVRRLEEHAKMVNDKYVDIYNKRKWPKKFNSAA